MTAETAGNPTDPAVLLFHGGGQTRHAWGGALREFSARSFSTASFDLPGHGDSGWVADGNYDLELFATSVADIANQFPRPALVGASLGGLSSLIAIGEGLVPDASALVLVDVTPTIEPAGTRRIRDFMRLGVDGFASLDEVADAISSYIPGRSRPKDLSGLSKNVRQRPDGLWVWHWDPAFFDHVDQDGGEPTAGRFTPPGRLQTASRNIKVPTLLVRGQTSDVVSDDGVAELRTLIPHLDVVDVAGAGHMVAGDKNDRFNAAVLTFLDAHARVD
ncbi:MAG: alpha/beta hydrolase [Ilumatobacteraceae bacterium]